MKSIITTFSLVLATTLGLSAENPSSSVETQPQFDRSKLISLDQALPESAKPKKPDYSVRRTEAKASTTTGYTVVYSSTVGAQPQLVKTSQLQNPTMNTQNVSMVQTFTTADGETVYVPIQVPVTNTTSTSVVIPSSATYKIIERQ